jgi:hypothetical protein
MMMAVEKRAEDILIVPKIKESKEDLMEEKL